MTATVTPAALAQRVQSYGLRIDEELASEFLDEWREQGIVCEVEPGEWQLTA
jgi:hypothetical protein